MSEVGQLTTLTTLHLQDNELTSLPRELGEFPRLTILDVTGNPRYLRDAGSRSGEHQ
ncbi:MAG: leucine-rich repeat domain-containing protein [Pseudonocardiaceae bacterium]